MNIKRYIDHRILVELSRFFDGDVRESSRRKIGAGIAAAGAATAAAALLLRGRAGAASKAIGKAAEKSATKAASKSATHAPSSAVEAAKSAAKSAPDRSKYVVNPKTRGEVSSVFNNGKTLRFE